jgi:hypothetical protein
MPRCHGDGIIHISNFSSVVYHDSPLYTAASKPPTAAETAIGELIAEHLVLDGATLQVRSLSCYIVQTSEHSCSGDAHDLNRVDVSEFV